MKKLFFAPAVISGIQLFLGVLFLTAGIGKLVPGFPGLMGPPWLEDVLVKYDLGLFARFIAFSQILIGWLLLSRRFATLGAVMLLPMLLNILMVTISMNWRGTPYVVSVFLILNLILLIADFHKLKFLISDNVEPLRPQPIIRTDPLSDKLIAVALLTFIAGASFGKTDKNIALALIAAGFLIGIVVPGTLYLLRKIQMRKVN